MRVRPRRERRWRRSDEKHIIKNIPVPQNVIESRSETKNKNTFRYSPTDIAHRTTSLRPVRAGSERRDICIFHIARQYFPTDVFDVFRIFPPINVV